MADDSLQLLLDTLNKWWREEDIPEEELKARVVLIYKKGNTANQDNYRPISLLNSTYKIFAAILQRRIAEAIDDELQPTQYGFRKNKSTADAIHCVRRFIEHGEQTTNTGQTTILVLLDWEKAFDKVDQKKLIEAMKRLHIPDKSVSILKAFYANPRFRIKDPEGNSKYYRQNSGIRQGCPLSQYLFICLMNVLFL